MKKYLTDEFIKGLFKKPKPEPKVITEGSLYPGKIIYNDDYNTLNSLKHREYAARKFHAEHLRSFELIEWRIERRYDYYTDYLMFKLKRDGEYYVCVIDLEELDRYGKDKKPYIQEYVQGLQIKMHP